MSEQFKQLHPLHVIAQSIQRQAGIPATTYPVIMGYGRRLTAHSGLERSLRSRGLAPAQLAAAVAGPARTAGEEVATTTREMAGALASDTKSARRELARAGKLARRDARRAGEAYARSAHEALEAIVGDLDKQARQARTRARKESRTGWRNRWLWLAAFALIALAAASTAHLMRARRRTDEQASTSEPDEEGRVDT